MCSLVLHTINSRPFLLNNLRSFQPSSICVLPFHILGSYLFFFCPLYQNTWTITLVTMFEFLQRSWASTLTFTRMLSCKFVPRWSNRVFVSKNYKNQSHRREHKNESPKCLSGTCSLCFVRSPRKQPRPWMPAQESAVASASSMNSIAVVRVIPSSPLLLGVLFSRVARG